MGAFLKLAALGAVVGGGSILALTLLVNGLTVLAAVSVAVMAVGAVAVIVAIARDTRRADGTVR